MAKLVWLWDEGKEFVVEDENKKDEEKDIWKIEIRYLLKTRQTWNAPCYTINMNGTKRRRAQSTLLDLLEEGKIKHRK